MNPPRLCYARYSSWTSAPTRVPDRCMGDILIACRPQEKATARDPRQEPREKSEGCDAIQVRFPRHGSGVRWRKKKPLKAEPSEACTIGAPSTWIFLVRLHACRA